MPRQIYSKEELLRLADNSRECRVVRRGDKVKIKLRRGRYLYTYVTTASEADTLLRQINLEKMEL